MKADDRARVPFALLGVLLLVSSLALAPTLGTRPTPETTAVERALDRGTAATQTAVRDGVATAGRRAAANPVLAPANTAVGRALNDSTPFRDALRLRIYLRVRERLQRVDAETGGVAVAAGLPTVDDTADYRAAIERVTVERAGPNRTALRATVEGVAVRVSRGDRVVTRRRVAPTVTVTTPVLLLHEQVRTYDRRVNRGLGGPGLGQRLTARLYPIAWTRGAAQYGGAPIENVVANRHVSLATNGALLGVQRSTFGRSDPDGRRALTEATAAVGVADVLRGSRPSPLVGHALDRAEYRPVGDDIATAPGDDLPERPRPNDTMRVGVDATADAAFRAVAAPANLSETTADAYTVEVTLAASSRHVGGGHPSTPPAPGENWTLVGTETATRTRVVGDADPRPAVPRGWHELDRFGRRVAVERVHTGVWENGSRRTTTAATATEYRVATVSLLGRHDGGSAAPRRGIATAHDAAGSPLDGPNLADVSSRAERALVARRGGRDAVAADAAVGPVSAPTVEVTGDRPDGLRAWVYRDLRRLREEVRSTNVTVERGAVGTFETNPARRLRERVASRRAALVDAPETYASTAQKARVAARVAYLDAVERRLAARARQRSEAGAAVDDRLRDRTGGSLADLRRSLTARETRVARARPAPVGPAGPVRTRVDARPQYLTLASVSRDRYPAMDGTEHPLVARNVNVFTVPYGDAADAVVGGLFSSADRARLGTAAAALRATETTGDAASNATLERREDGLRRRIERANDAVAAELAETVAAETDANGAESRAVVRAGLSEWNTTSGRAQALANGPAAVRVADAAARERDLSRVERDWLRVRLAGTVDESLARPIARPRQPAVERAATTARAVARDRLKSTVANATRERAERYAKKKLGTKALPAGLPLAPPLTPWYATANVWWVTVEGEYARFAVTADHGTPTTPGARTTYVRDGDAVTLDVDGDGEPERLGRSSRLTFRASTGVVVVVGPNPRGVGDKDGVAVETSAGWPSAGPT
ncbi:DUF7286 family protein [Haloarcula litorea]|uniref:DUF7286 family protein n=1 Tax=Haloarcula litorea TaxID=3032579 RepID=UPI0023E821E8|nr:hypothetical protein [Halomicroarcula sp. GDY20]